MRAALAWLRPAPDPAAGFPTLHADAAPFVPDRARLQRFCELVGHRNTALLPLTYPQVLAGPLQLALLTSSQCPVNPMGIVHVSNRIVLRQPVAATQPLTLTVSLAEQGATARGRELALATTAHDASGQPVWQAQATLLARYAVPRTARPARARTTETQPMNEIASFPVPAATGRRYARVSGDYNPIHLSALSARAFGFRRAIAHGMWSLARVLGVLSDAGAPQQAEVRFRRPLSMPAEVVVYAGRGEAAPFALRDRKSGKNYLIGALSEPT